MLNQILKNPVALVIVTVLIALIIVTLLDVIIPAIKKKNIDIPGTLAKAEKVVDTADSIINTANTIVPANPAIEIIKLISSIAKTAVNSAEQLYIASQLSADQRKAKASELVSAALKIAKIETTPELEKVIDGAIEAEVLSLGHAPADIKKIQDTNTQLQEQNTQLQTSLQQLQNVQAENEQIKQKLAAVQSVIVQQ